MRTTGRSESMNAFFDGFVTHNSILINFANGYEKALERRREAEEETDFHCSNRRPVLKTRHNIEAQMTNFFTLNIFIIFQKEVEESVYYIAEKVDDDGAVQQWQVFQYEDHTRNPHVVKTKGRTAKRAKEPLEAPRSGENLCRGYNKWVSSVEHHKDIVVDFGDLVYCVDALKDSQLKETTKWKQAHMAMRDEIRGLKAATLRRDLDARIIWYDATTAQLHGKYKDCYNGYTTDSATHWMLLFPLRSNVGLGFDDGCLARLVSDGRDFESVKTMLHVGLENEGLAGTNLKLSQELVTCESKLNELQAALNEILVQKEESHEQLHSSKKTIEDLSQKFAEEGKMLQLQISSVAEEINLWSLDLKQQSKTKDVNLLYNTPMGQ
ncbi:hypothetical protein ACLOJK_008467 [Asimina triloba]